MKFFEKFKKQKGNPQQSNTISQPVLSPAPNTSVTVFFDRDAIPTEELEQLITSKFGAGAVCSVDDSRPSVTHFMLHINGMDLVCSYMPFPYPGEECDIPALFRLNHYITQEEQKALAEHKSFCVLAELGGGTTLAGKRSVCRTLTSVCSALLQAEGAAGGYYSAANLLLGKNMYLNHAVISEREGHDPEYFPSVLWILAYQTRAEDGSPAIETCGLAQFGFLELQFYNPREDWAHSFEKLYLMSIFQITGKQVYKNMDTICFSPDTISVFKQCGEKLSVIGGI